MEKHKEIAAILNEVINLLAPYDENWTNSLKRLKKKKWIHRQKKPCAT